MSVKDVVVPVKSASDERDYRIFTMSNDLQVIICSDPSADKSAASISVNVGSFSDPESCLGLAHFLEHMLFLGTEKYPDENSYSNALNKYGGALNAWTDREFTNYFFDVKCSHLEEILDRFSQFFIAPLFTESSTFREMNAVHSEHQKNIFNDMWRNYQMTKTAMNPKHPFGRFATGDLRTLNEMPKAQGVDIREELLKFHKTYYSSNVMKLCIIGQEDLDTLQEWAIKYFGDISNHKAKSPSFSTDVSGDTGVVFEYSPVRDLRQLIMSWTAETDAAIPNINPWSFISHILGYEGKGSVLSLLKDLGLAEGLSAGRSQKASCFSQFSITVELTEVGLMNTVLIQQIIYNCINLIKNSTEEELVRIHNEATQLNELTFRFKSKESVFDYCSSLTQNLFEYPAEKVMYYDYVQPDFDYSVVQNYLSNLTVGNSLTFIVAKETESHADFKFGSTSSNDKSPKEWKEERWYGTKYASYSLNKDDITMIKSKVNFDKLTVVDTTGVNPVHTTQRLSLPSPNKYISTDFTIVTDEVDEKQVTTADDDVMLPQDLPIDPGHMNHTQIVSVINPEMISPYTSILAQNTTTGALFRKQMEPVHLARPLLPPQEDLEKQGKYAWLRIAPVMLPVVLGQGKWTETVSADDDDNDDEQPEEGEEDEEHEHGENCQHGDEEEEKLTTKLDPKLDAEITAAMTAPLTPNLPAVELWYKLDRVFVQPKVWVEMKILSPNAYNTVKNHVLCNLYLMMVQESLNETLYDADLAGLKYQMEASVNGISVTFTGYSHKVHILMDTVLSQLKKCPLEKEMFEMQYNKLMRKLKNQTKTPSYSQARYNAQYASSDPIFHYTDKIKVLKTITLDDLTPYPQQLLSQGVVQMYVHGNISRNSAIRMAQRSVYKLDMKTVAQHELQQQRRVLVPLQNAIYTQWAHSNLHEKENAIANIYQFSPPNLPHINHPDTRLMAVSELLCTIMNDICYDTLRTKEQLGYVVWSFPSNNNEGYNLNIIIQSSQPPSYLDNRIEAFLNVTFVEFLNNLGEEDFNNYVNAKIAQLTEKETDLRSEMDRNWDKICQKSYNFDRRFKIAEFLTTVTKDDLATFFNQFLSLGGEVRRKWSHQIYSKASYARVLAANKQGTYDRYTEPLAEGLNAGPKVDGPIVRHLKPNQVPVFKLTSSVSPASF